MSELHFLTATELARLIRARQVSAVEVLEAHLDRIEQVNPHVNAIVTLVADRAMEAARAADAALSSGGEAGPLHGVPVAHKDLVDTAGIRTTYGSPLFAEHVPDHDDVIVQRLRAAGAVTVGKTNTPEFGTGSHTVNEVFGATRNPYDLTKSAGGSSGGAAAALATGMVPLADGSDMGGSLRNPASFCNVVGLRPTPGRVPDISDINAWYTLGVPGPMARTVEDVTLMLGAIAGFDRRSPYSIKEVFAPEPEQGVAGLRVAWSPDLGGLPVDPRTAAVTATAPAVFERLGARVEQVELDLSDAEDAFRTYRAWNYLLVFGDLHGDTGGLGPNTAWNVEQGRKVTGADLARAERARSRLYQRMAAFFDTYDVLLAPVSQVPPFPIEQPYVSEINGQKLPDYLAWMRSAYWISVLHAPAASVPAGFTEDGLPVGVQIVGRPFEDARVLRVARAFEQATGHGLRRPPL
ncbi:Amidase [[Actinomadura] parvosata subsp. kistnae]|uniref:Amidase n=1 Tax=[Actinomadura] parvosata subsp. kistnae TaxID=1909395 RepID=A0A1V0A3Q9_9ACTN|nr:amidase [Nonomuraea sp. ATCC 55076]AQZ64789.1 amidase [Nonomuraea sp. ATCC 55076]SPL98447.1 Amidase [Actinomadura parvosata subsp. kistnae]